MVHYFDKYFQANFVLEIIKDINHMGTAKIIKVDGDSKSANKTVQANVPNESNVKLSNLWPNCFPLPNLSESHFIKSHLDSMANNQPAYLPKLLKCKVHH